MYNRDYTIRLIQQFFVLLARLLGLKAKDDPAVVLIETEQGLRMVTGLPADLIRRLTADSIASIMSARDDSDSLLAMTAILLKMEGDAFGRAGDIETAANSMQKAMDLAAKINRDQLAEDLRLQLPDRGEFERALASLRRS